MANVSQNAPTPQRWGAIIWLLISQIIGLIPLIPWLIAAPMSLMAFDSGVSNEAMLFVGAVWCYPALPIGAAIVAWILFALKKDKAALIVTSLPVLVAAPLLGFIVYTWFGGG